MRAAYYEANGPARSVLQLGEVATPEPGPGEVRVKLASLGCQSLRRQGARRSHAQNRLAAGDSAQRRCRHDRRGRRGRQPDPHRRAGVDLECAMEARLRHLCRICRAAAGHGGAAAGPYWLCRGRLSRHSGNDCLSRRLPSAEAWAGATVLIAGGAGGVGHYAIQFAKARGAVVHHHGQFAGQGRTRAEGRRRPHHRLQARRCRRARDGTHRQWRGRRGDRTGPLGECQAAAQACCGRAARSSSTAPEPEIADSRAVAAGQCRLP